MCGMWFWWHSFKACFLLGTDGILSCIIVGINHHPPQEWYPTCTNIEECLWNIHSIAMSGALAEGEYKIDCNHQLDRWLQNMPHHLRRWLGYGRQHGTTTDRRPLEAKSTESLPSREVSRGRRPPGASPTTSSTVSRGHGPPGAASSRNVSRSRAPPAMRGRTSTSSTSTVSREVSRGRASTSTTSFREVSRSRASQAKMSREVSGGRAVPPRASSSSSGARSTTRVHYSRTQGQDKTGVSSRESYRNMFRDTRELPAADVTAEPSVAQLAEQMKAMQDMIAALSKQQTPQAAPLAPPTSQPTPLAAPMPPPAPLTPQPATPAPQPTPPTPQPTPPVPEMMVLGSDILDVVKQLDLAAVEEVETSGTSWEEMVAAEEPNCQAVEDMLLGDSNEDAPSAASQ